MPRIPQIGGAAPIRPTLLPPERGVGTAVAGLGGALAEGVQSIADRRAELSDERDFLDATRDISKGLNALRLEIDSSEDPDSADTYRERADALVSERISSVENIEVRNALERGFARRIDAADISVREKAAVDREAIQGEHLRAALLQIQSGYVSATSDEEQQGLLGDAAWMIEMFGQSAGLEPADRQQSIREFTAATQKLFVSQLVSKNPALALRRLKAGDFAGLLPKDRESGIGDAEIGIGQLEVEQRRIENERQSRAHTEFIVRMDSDDPLEYPSRFEIESAELGPGATKQLLGMRRKLANNERASETDFRVTGDLYARVYSGDITDVTELIPYIGEGLSIPNLNTLANIIKSDDPKDPRLEEIRRRRANLNRTIRQQINQSSILLGPSSPLGSEAAYGYSVIVGDRYVKGMEDGKDPLDLMNPVHDDYVAKDIVNHIPTPSDQWRALSESLGGAVGKLGVEDEEDVNLTGEEADILRRILTAPPPVETEQ